MQGRNKMHDDINAVGEKEPLDNCPINLLNDSDSEISECKVKTEQQIISEYKEWEAVNRSETSSQYEHR